MMQLENSLVHIAPNAENFHKMQTVYKDTLQQKLNSENHQKESGVLKNDLSENRRGSITRKTYNQS